MFKTIEAITYDFGGDLFIDIGGNVGMWTTQLVDLYTKIIFIEPSGTALEQAKLNIQQRCENTNVSVDNITYIKAICTNVEDQTRSIYSGTNDTGNFSIFAKDLYGEEKMTMQEENIPTITIDSLIDRATNESKILIKIDTEGSDLDILLGGLKFFERYKPTIIMEAHYHMYFDEKKHKTAFDFLKNLGYTIHEFKYSGYINNPEKIFDGTHNGIQMYDKHFQIVFIPLEK